MSRADSLRIHPPFEAFYIDCMLWHSSSAVQSITEVGGWIRENDPKSLELPQQVLFEKLQNIVLQSASLSRYFWPSPRKPAEIHFARASCLRQGLDVTETSPLHNRDLRNGLEHFDEKLDLYLSGNVVGQFIPDLIDYEEPESEVPLHIFKAFYTQQLVFVLLGRRYEMTPLVNEILRVNAALIECQQNGYRLPLPLDA